MKKILCPHCESILTISENSMYESSILCPYCRNVFKNTFKKDDLKISRIFIFLVIFVLTLSVWGNQCSFEAFDNTQTVQNSGIDASVHQVKKYLKNNLKDPKSYESIEWSQVNWNGDQYVVRHKYRAKNSYGGYVVSNKLFYLDRNGYVTKVEDY